MTEQNIFQRINIDTTLLVYVSFPQCTVCVSLLPKMKSLLQDYDHVQFLYVDSSKFPAVSGQLLVFAAPTVILFHQGKEVKRWSRVFSVDHVRQELDRLSE